jgi:hypothetical protein
MGQEKETWVLRGRRKVFVCCNISEVASDEVEAENALRERRPYRNSTRDKCRTENFEA